MDYKVLQNQLKNSKIRQGPLYKRSKFLKQWRQRWVVLTLNYLFTFTNKSCKEVTEVIEVKDIKSYKSYLRKDQQMIPPGFKIRSDDDQFYFCGRNTNQKWSWIVTLERLMDYKYAGASTYNNIDFIKTKGFLAQVQFQNGMKGEKVTQMPQAKKIENKKSAEEATKQVDIQVEKILQELEKQKQQLKVKELQFSEKEKVLKEQQDALKKQESQKQKAPVKKIEQQAPQKVSPVKEQETGTRNTLPTGTKVSQLKNLFEQKMVQSSKQTAPSYKLGFNSNKNQRISKVDHLYALRSKTVANLFEEFHLQLPQPDALKYTLDFLIKMSSDQKFGYSSSITAEIKTHQNRGVLAQIFMELITDFKDLQNCDLVVKFIETCFFNASGLFNQNHMIIIANKLIQFFLQVEDEQKIQVLMRNMFIINKIHKYSKHQGIKNKMNKLLKEAKREENKNWARKLVQQF